MRVETEGKSSAEFAAVVSVQTREPSNLLIYR
jgi:hypothetical protein